MTTTLQSLAELQRQVAETPFVQLTGRFHAHLTVMVGQESVDRLQQLCKSIRVKLTVVDLESLAGRTQKDVMTTSYYVDPSSGAVGRIVQHLSTLAETLRDNQFSVVRAKLEHESLPSLSPYSRRNYHEVHVKLRIPAGDYDRAYARLKSLGAELQFVPSRNPRERDASFALQFVNMRIYEGHRESADATVNKLAEHLREASFDVVEIKRETTVFDTHQQLDQWWT